MADSPSIKQKEEAYSTVSTSDFKAKVGPSSDTYTCIHILHEIRDRVLGLTIINNYALSSSRI